MLWGNQYGCSVTHTMVWKIKCVTGWKNIWQSISSSEKRWKKKKINKAIWCFTIVDIIFGLLLTFFSHMLKCLPRINHEKKKKISPRFFCLMQRIHWMNLLPRNLPLSWTVQLKIHQGQPWSAMSVLFWFFHQEIPGQQCCSNSWFHLIQN